MTATNHMLTGAVIALAIQKPLLAIPLALLSHFALDMVPHAEPRDFSPAAARKIIFTDGFVAACLTATLPLALTSTASPWVILSCMIAAIIPDLIWAIRYFRIKDMDKVFTEPMSIFSSLHLKIQWSESIQGFFVEAIWLLSMAYVLFALSKP